MRNDRISPLRHAGVVAVLLLVFAAVLPASDLRGQEPVLESLFQRAQADPSLRPIFIDRYVAENGLPEHVQRLGYSEGLTELALTNPLRQSRNGDYGLTTTTRGIGYGYPSIITFGPRMFQPAFNYADFQSVVTHEATHAKFWATGELNYMDHLDTNDARMVKGVLPILFELDAIKTQMEQPGWRQTSEAFRTGQEAYRQQWLDKLNALRQQLYNTNMAPLLDRIWSNYRY